MAVKEAKTMASMQEARTGYYFECLNASGQPETCGFQLRDCVLAELLDLAAMHVARSHGNQVKPSDLRPYARSVNW